MRVRDGDRGDAAQRLNPGYSIAFDEANAIPKNVTGPILNQESALADGELGFGAKTINSWALRIELVTMGGS